MNAKIQQYRGHIAAMSAFAFWGLMVVFWQCLSERNALELIAHRILWSPIILIAVVVLRGNVKSLLEAFNSKRILSIHLTNGVLLSVNWLAYVYAVTHHQILQGSLAYFMVPVLNTCIGFLVLKEKLTVLQWVAISVASLGVANEIYQFGRVPWLALVIAFTFAFYGMNKSRSSLGPISALTLETSLLFPFAAGVLVYLHLKGVQTVSLVDPIDLTWMFATGITTILPLLLFAYGAKRIQMVTIGIFQFIAPSVKLILGTLVYKESFPPSKVITFALIWVAIALYLVHVFRRSNQTSNAS